MSGGIEPDQECTIKPSIKRPWWRLGMLLLLPVIAAADWGEEHRRAEAMAAEHQWNKMLERHNTLPAASGSEWQMPNQQAQNYLDYLRQIAKEDVDLRVEDGSPGIAGCDVDAVSRSYLIHQLPPGQVARNRQESAKLLRREDLEESFRLLSGHCENGKLHGPVVAIFTDHSRVRSQYVNGETLRLGRIDGHFDAGVLYGEVRVLLRDRSDISGAWLDAYFLSIGVYERGRQVGTHVTLAENAGGEVVFVAQALQEGRSLHNTWMNGRPNTRYHMLDGVLDGWMAFASAVLQDSPQCYRAGQQLTATTYCQQLATELEGLSRAEPHDGYRRLAQVGVSEVAGRPLPAAETTETSAEAPGVSGSASGTSDASAPWRIPQVGHYRWLNPPTDRALDKPPVTALLPRLQAVLQDDVTARLLPGEPKECALDDDTESYLLFQMAAQDYRAANARQKQLGTLSEDSPAEIVLTAGACNGGRPEGAFTAHYRYKHRFSIAGSEADFDIYGRVDGAFADGRLHGELQRIWLKDLVSKSFLSTEVGASLASFDNGERQAGEVALVAMPATRATRLLLKATRADGRERIEIWHDGKPQTALLLKQGVNDGYLKYFDPLLRNMSTCYRDGVETRDESYCRKLGL